MVERAKIELLSLSATKRFFSAVARALHHPDVANYLKLYGTKFYFVCARISITAARIIPATPAATIEIPIMLTAKPSQYVDDIVDDISSFEGG